jgi:hypothetical protein
MVILFLTIQKLDGSFLLQVGRFITKENTFYKLFMSNGPFKNQTSLSGF